jgi:integrase
MHSENLPVVFDLNKQTDSWELDRGQSPSEASMATGMIRYWPFGIEGALPTDSLNSTAPSGGSVTENQADNSLAADGPGISVLEFVERKFVPEYVTHRRSAGRAHFQSILKHILTPEGVDRAFQIGFESSRVRLRRFPNWPYIDSLPLQNVTREHVQQLVSTALSGGYSIQTVTHIRNVVRAIFAHAKNVSSFSGENPARSVSLPEMARKQTHALTLDELKRVIQLMRYPEREVALFAIFTRMSVAEICGLQWKYVNLSDVRRMVDGDWLPPRTIAVRNQSYRGEFGLVMSNRQRTVAIPDLLCSVITDLKMRKHFTSAEDFVLPSRCGTPISQDNVATRRLKSIGNALGMPWLSWYVFHRTHVSLFSENGHQLQRELKRVITLEKVMARYP